MYSLAQCKIVKQVFIGFILLHYYFNKLPYYYFLFLQKDLVESEVLRRIERLKAHNDNDTWEKRTSPPTTWNDPLPEWMEEKLKYSYLKEKSVKVSNETEKSFCVLM